MKLWKILVAIAVIAGIWWLSVTYIIPAFDEFTGPVYDAAYAREVCGDRNVDGFDPKTGIVACELVAEVDVAESEEPEKDDSSESDETPAPEDKDETTSTSTPVVETDDCHLMSGAEFQGWNAEGEKDDDYNISVNCDGWYWQSDLPTAVEREWHLVSLSIPEGDYLFNGVSCSLYLDPDRNELGSENPLVVSYGNGLPFSVELPDDATYETAYGIVKCDDTEVTGFSIEVAP